MSYNLHLNRLNGATSPDRAGQKRKRTSQERSSREDIAWSTARCNRLLRTITSRINTLRRLLDTVDKGHNGQSTKPPPSSGPNRATEHWSTTDPVWLPTGPRKPQRTTYTGKAKLSKSYGTQTIRSNGAVSLAFPSPFVKRVKPTDVSGKTLESRGLGALKNISGQTRRSRQLPLMPTSDIQEAQKGLEGSLEKLLEATRDPSAKNDRGTRSLLQTCLRNVPRYIDVHNFEIEDGSEYDTTNEIFSYLEGFGTLEGGGWVGLRDVVRHQAAHLLCGAIHDRLLSEDTITALVNVCSAQKATVEGQQILQCWLLSIGSLQARQIGKISSWAMLHDCEGFKYRTFLMLAEKNPVNYGRIGDLARFGNDLLSSLSGYAGDDAVEYYQRWIAFSVNEDVVGRLKERTQREAMETMIKLLVMSVTGSLLGNSHFDPRKLHEAVYSIAISIALEQPEIFDKTQAKIARLSLFCARLLTSLGRSTYQNTRLPEAFARGFYNTCGTAKDGGSLDVQEQFATEFAQSLTELEKHVPLGIQELYLNAAVGVIETSESENHLLKAVALEVITLVQQTAGDDAPYAEYLQRIMSSRGESMPPKTPHPGARQNRFRWEDGLCEWIAATPFALDQASSTELDTDSHMGETGGTSVADSDCPQTCPPSPCSPDVLALSSPVMHMRVAARSNADERACEGRGGVGVVYVQRGTKRGRKSKKAWGRQESADSSSSCDELAL